MLAGDHLKLLGNAIRWATNEAPPVTVSGKGVLDITIWRQRESIAVHLVNLTNPMMMKGPVREIMPLPTQSVRILLAGGAKPKAVRLLVAGTEAAHRLSGGAVELELPSVGLHEVIAIDLG